MRILIGLLLAGVLLPVLLRACQEAAGRAGALVHDGDGVGLFMLVLAAIGYVLWQRRGDESRREGEERRHHLPRQRTLPPAPGVRDDMDGEGR